MAGGDPLTTIGVCATVPRYGVTTYEVNGTPPVSVGAVQDTVAGRLPRAVTVLPTTAVTFVGAAGAISACIRRRRWYSPI